VLEELGAEIHWHQILAGRVTAFIAKPQVVAALFLNLNEIRAMMRDLMGRLNRLKLMRRESPRREPG
jgi:hypothetical protein